jgi:4-hydroxybenzoate polyprenyltransferase
MIAQDARSIAQDVRSVIVHARWPVQSYVLLGFLFGSLVAQVPFSGRVLVAFISWLLICAGLTVFNSYYDKDEEPVGGMMNPPKVTISLLYGSIIMQLIGLVMAVFVGNPFFGLCILIVVIYFFYSHKSFRLKSNGYLAVILNSILGLLTVLAAASLTVPMFTLPVILGAITAACFKASVYMMMQVHQIEEDKQRGDTSIAVIYGRDTTLKAALFFIVVAAVFGLAALYTSLNQLLLPILFFLYFMLLAYLFVSWIRRPGDSHSDMLMMMRMIYVSGYLGSAVCFVIYIYYFGLIGRT